MKPADEDKGRPVPDHASGPVYLTHAEMKPADVTELKPCPFCGGEAELHYDRGPTGERYAWVGCNQCDVMSGHVDVASMMPEETHPITAWNTRATPVVKQSLTADVTEADKRLFIAIADKSDHDDEIMAGHHFTWEVAEIARYRIAAYEAGRVAGLEEAAEVCDREVLPCDLGGSLVLDLYTAETIQTAIRALKEKNDG